jgi:2',3'-cyclic-nucleotide 2'-phosphodiesterase (5'-nucleotidase family)
LEKGRPESKLGNFVADACMDQAALHFSSDKTQIDFCFLNNGGLRNALPAGAITRRHVFELMPFENELIVLTVDSSVLVQLFDYMASKDGVPVSNIKFKMKDKKAVDIFIGTQPFDKGRIYKLITSDYLANGGDNLGFLAAVQQREYTGLKVRDAVIKQLDKINSEGKTVKASIEGRITYAE